MTDEALAVPESHGDILEAKGFAHVATIGPHGEPQCNPVWYEWDGTHLRFSTIKARMKYRNLSRDNRIAVSICDPRNPDRQIELRGTVLIHDDPQAALIRRLSERYTGAAFDGNVVDRVIVEMTPRHFTTHG
jgi:PPOX class probable F420-dependent enzyme